MSFINKPKVRHPDLPKNELGLTRRDYEGAMSTLCAGCGHDSITASIIQAIWELGIRPERLAKLSGIGCSSKTTAYFASGAHGFNGVHGRMPSIAAGANAANRDLHYIGVSGDGDSLSIGFGQFAHAIRRNVNMLYMCENNGVYGLTKGQFSASADIGTKSKKGDENLQAPVDPCLAALSLGGTFIARSFSGDREQLVPLIKAGLMHKGFAMIDVSRRASRSTTTSARRRVTSSRASTTTKPCMRITSRCARRSRPPTPRARFCPCRCTTAAGSGCASSTRITTRPIAARPSSSCARSCAKASTSRG